MLKRAAIVLGCVVGLAAQAQTLTFEQAWQELVRADDQISAGQAAEQRAAALVKSHQSMLLPQVDVVASYTRLEKPVELDALALEPLSDIANTASGQALIDFVGGEDWFITPVSKQDVVRSSLVALWPLYTGGKIKAAGELAKLGQAESAALLEEVQRLRFTVLANNYYGLLLAERINHTLSGTEAVLNEHVQAALARERSGQLAKVERMAMEVARDEAQLKASAGKQKQEVLQQAFRSLVHAQEASPVSHLFVNDALPSLAELQEGLREHPSLQVLAAKEGQARVLAKASRGLYHPNVFMYGSYHLYDNNDYASDITPDWFVGVGVRLPLVDRSGRRNKVHAADSAVAEAESLQAGTLRQLSVLLERQYSDVQQALVEYRTLKAHIALAEETLHLQRRAFEEGLARSLDVVDAQQALTTAQTRRYTAAAKYVTGLAQLLTLAGRQSIFFHMMQEGEPVL